MIVKCIIILLFSISRSETGVYVHHLMSGSLAEECGRVLVGDRILEVDGVDVRNATVEETATIMAVSGRTHTHRVWALVYRVWALVYRVWD